MPRLALDPDMVKVARSTRFHMLEDHEYYHHGRYNVNIYC
jgi:hypothetical protein